MIQIFKCSLFETHKPPKITHTPWCVVWATEVGPPGGGVIWGVILHGKEKKTRCFCGDQNRPPGGVYWGGLFGWYYLGGEFTLHIVYLYIHNYDGAFGVGDDPVAWPVVTNDCHSRSSVVTGGPWSSSVANYCVVDVPHEDHCAPWAPPGFFL